MTATGTTSHLIELEERYTAHNYKPLDVVLARGEGVWVWDVEGRRYMDFLSAYSAVNQGHCHPRIVAAVIEQAQRLTLCSRAFRHDRLGPLCERLTKRLGYDKVLLMNSGAEAVETAIKAARKWGYDKKGIAADRAQIVVFDGNFHGRTTTIVGFSSTPSARTGFGPFAPGFVRVPYGDAAAVERALSPDTAAVLVEPIQGEGGVVVPPAGFLPRVAELCRSHNVLLICDEIQSGLGRAGAWLAHTQEGVHADAVVVGKALGGGLYPISGLLADDALMDVFSAGTHGSTFGGNPLACAAADAALDVLEDEDLIANSARLGERLLERLRRLPQRLVAQVRGRGLWAGIQLHESAGGARRVCEALRGEEILCKETHEHTIRLAPPLVITADQLDWALERIERVFEAA